MSVAIDPITLASVWGGLIAITEEIGVTIRRSAYSESVREGQDFSVGMFDREGQLIAQGNFSPGHLGSMPFIMKHVLGYYPLEAWQPGDTVIVNDPLIGTGHLPDIFAVVPVFFEGQVVAFISCVCHHVDVGGAAPGSQAVEGVLDLYQEGIRLLPVKLYRGGEPVEDIFRLILANVRDERKTLGDLRAQRNALEHQGVPRLLDYYRRYGADTMQACNAEVLRRTEDAVRDEITKLPDGTYSFVNYLDDYGPGTPPVKLNVTVEISGSDITVDFTGSDDQVPAGVNCYINYTRSYVFCALKAILASHVPQNEGGIKPIKVVAPEGSYFNPRHGAPCGARMVNSVRLAESVMGALAPVSDRVVAPYGGASHGSFGGIDPQTGRRVVGTEFLFTSHGARANKDGLDLLAGPFNIQNIPVEVWETSYPLRVEKLMIAKDSGGPGRFRGGVGIYKEVRFLIDDFTYTNLTEKEKYVPPGPLGGRPGAKGSTVLVQGDEERVLEGKGTYHHLKYGAVLKLTAAGAGGFGDPLERDPQKVLDDVWGGLVSVEGARRDYGVVIDDYSLTVDLEVTQAVRASMRASGESTA